MKITRKQLRRLVLEVVEGTKVTSKRMGNMQLRIMNWQAQANRGKKQRAEVAKTVTKWKESESGKNIYKTLKDDQKVKVDKLAKGEKVS